jgi:hypothetical protein
MGMWRENFGRTAAFASASAASGESFVALAAYAALEEESSNDLSEALQADSLTGIAQFYAGSKDQKDAAPAIVRRNDARDARDVVLASWKPAARRIWMQMDELGDAVDYDSLESIDCVFNGKLGRRLGRQVQLLAMSE